MENESLVICSKCNGKGSLGIGDDSVDCLCDKCWGLGKLDWVENVVGKDPWRFKRSSLDDINIRMLINYVKDGIEKICESLYGDSDRRKATMVVINNYLRNLHGIGMIYDYNISVSPSSDEYIFYVNLKLNRSIETIKITTHVR